MPASGSWECGYLSLTESPGCHRAIIRRKYLENADRFHRQVAEGKEPWVKNRTPDDAGEL